MDRGVGGGGGGGGGVPLMGKEHRLGLKCGGGGGSWSLVFYLMIIPPHVNAKNIVRAFGFFFFFFFWSIFGCRFSDYEMGQNREKRPCLGGGGVTPRNPPPPQHLPALSREELS